MTTEAAALHHVDVVVDLVIGQQLRGDAAYRLAAILGCDVAAEERLVTSDRHLHAELTQAFGEGIVQVLGGVLRWLHEISIPLDWVWQSSMSELDVPPTQDDLEGDGELDDEPKPVGVVGRLVEDDEGAATDEEAATVADESDDAQQLTAEEAAMHIADQP